MFVGLPLLGFLRTLELSPNSELWVFESGRWPELMWWTLFRTFQFMTNCSYLGRWGGAGREEAHSPKDPQ